MPEMQDGRGQRPSIQQPETAELGLQRAIVISGGTSWSDDGNGGAIIHGGYRDVRLGRDTRIRISMHSGNDDAIQEILDELSKPAARKQIRKQP